MIGLVFKGCSTLPTPAIETAELPPVYQDLREKKVCRGKGYIISDGEMKGRLNFTFTASRDTAYIQFTDLIGRKALFLILKNQNIDAWDMRNNRRYDQTSILISLPFFEIISASELRTFLWGSIPTSFSEPKMIISQSEKISGIIQFKSRQTEYGPLVSHLSFKLEENNQNIELVMMNRQFDLQYPHLIKDIPKSVIPVKVNS